MNANTGVFASIFAELGYFGLIISVFVLIFILNTLIILHKKYNLLGYLIIINFSFLLINSPLNDVFLTHGYLIIMLIAVFLQLKKIKYEI